MAFLEQRVLKQVSLLLADNEINVQWSDQVLKDGEIIAESFHRKSYSQDQITEFLAEVDNASVYIAAIGWTVP